MELLNYMSGLVAVAALVYSFFQGYQQQQFNKLSVKPLPLIWPVEYKDKIRLLIKNKGTGPLIIKKMKFYTESGSLADAVIDLLPKLKDHPKEEEYNIRFISLQYLALAPTEEIYLFEMNGNHNDDEFIAIHNYAKDVLKDVTVKIEFENIFGDKNKISEKLTWFDDELNGRKPKIAHFTGN